MYKSVYTPKYLVTLSFSPESSLKIVAFTSCRLELKRIEFTKLHAPFTT